MRRITISVRVSLVALLCFFFLTACAPVQSMEQDVHVGDELVWTDHQERLEIRWSGEVRAYPDLQTRRSFFNKLSAFLFGADMQKLVKPYGLYVDASERFLIADPGASLVHLMALDTYDYRLVAHDGSQEFLTPIGVSGNGKESYYFSDSTRGVVYVGHFDGDAPAQFNQKPLIRPTGVAFHDDNWLLYVVDTGAHQVVALGPDGLEKFRFGSRGTGLGQFNFPTDIWIDNQGHVYINDTLNARVQVFAADGTPLRTIGSRGHSPGYLDRPKGIAVDKAGNLYVCDSMQDAIQVFDRDGGYLMTFGVTGQQPGQFWMPSGLFIDDEKIYVSDSYNARIQIFTYEGTM
jgi:sugar lactone lactonase YvrE